MRIEKLNNDKIKVTLTSNDLINLDVDLASLSPNSQELHNFLFNIMETIQIETGFNPYNGQVVVEATPSSDGMSILVSKIKPIQKQNITKEELKKGITVKARLKKQRDTTIFYFDIFEDLCNALRELNREELIESSLYSLNKVFCYVLHHSSHFLRCNSVLTEFSSKPSKYPMQFTYIKEHGKLIAEGEKLADMAQNLQRLV